MDLQDRIKAAVIVLQDEIEEGLLPTRRITEVLNQMHPDDPLTAISVGLAIRQMGLRSRPVGQHKLRCVELSPDFLASLEAPSAPPAADEVPDTIEKPHSAPAIPAELRYSARIREILSRPPAEPPRRQWRNGGLAEM